MGAQHLNHSRGVVDIYTGSIGSDRATGWRYSSATIYFDANDGSTGDELWAHDLKPLHWQVANIQSGSSASSPGHYTQHPRRRHRLLLCHYNKFRS